MTEIIRQYLTPTWVTYVGIFVPISISVAVMIISLVRNRKSMNMEKEIEEMSEKLQSEITKREEYIQMRSIFLKIYDDFCLAQSVLGRMSKRVHIIFSNYSVVNGSSEPYQLVCEVNNIANIICQSVNKAKLLLPYEDKDFSEILNTIYQKYLIICKKLVPIILADTVFSK